MRVYLGTGAVLSTDSALQPVGAFTLSDNVSHLVLSENTARLGARFWNLDSSAQVFIGLGQAAVANQGAFLGALDASWGTPEDTGGVVFMGAIFLISPTVAPVAISFIEL